MRQWVYPIDAVRVGNPSILPHVCRQYCNCFEDICRRAGQMLYMWFFVCLSECLCESVCVCGRKPNWLEKHKPKIFQVITDFMDVCMSACECFFVYTYLYIYLCVCVCVLTLKYGTMRGFMPYEAYNLQNTNTHIHPHIDKACNKYCPRGEIELKAAEHRAKCHVCVRDGVSDMYACRHFDRRWMYTYTITDRKELTRFVENENFSATIKRL